MAVAATSARAADTPEATAAPTTVTLTPARPKLLLGTDAEVTVTLDVRGPESESFVPVRALANVGTLETPRAAGSPGHFIARYLPPAERYPQVALLVVELASGARRMHVAARIMLEGATVVPFHTSPGASVTMRVADRNFGPVVADRQGRVEIPIQVPPGIRAGTARAVDQYGAARETEVDLQQAPFPRVLVLAPPTLDVGSFSEIVLVAVEPDGTPASSSRLTLGASAGLLHPLGAGALGEARFLFEAPRKLGSGAVALTAMAAGPPASRSDTAVAMRVGASTPAHDLPQHAQAGGRQRRNGARRRVGARRLRQPDERDGGRDHRRRTAPPGHDRRRRPGHVDRRRARQVQRPRAHLHRGQAGRHPHHRGDPRDRRPPGAHHRRRP